MENFIMNRKYLWVNILLMFITYGLWIIVYFCLRHKYSNSASTRKTDLNSSSSKHYARTFVLKVAGVTYKNEDGTDRQKLISLLAIGQPLKLVPYTYDNRDAIYVETIDNKILGNIPTDHTVEILNKLKNDKIQSVSVVDMGTFINENNQKIYYLKIELLIK